eukprot:6203501-Pleurochrysis_carterae.AAC.1
MPSLAARRRTEGTQRQRHEQDSSPSTPAPHSVAAQGAIASARAKLGCAPVRTCARVCRRRGATRA